LPFFSVLSVSLFLRVLSSPWPFPPPWSFVRSHIRALSKESPPPEVQLDRFPSLFLFPTLYLGPSFPCTTMQACNLFRFFSFLLSKVQSPWFLFLHFYFNGTLRNWAKGSTSFFFGLSVRNLYPFCPLRFFWAPVMSSGAHGIHIVLSSSSILPFFFSPKVSQF